MTKISIIVPVYNVYNYLDKCLNSLINQTLKDIEIIVVNDGTKDNSQEIIDKYGRLDKRVIALKKKNGGLSDARNYAIPYAKGEYIAFIDSDDYVDVDMYEKMYKKAKEKDYDLVECDFFWEYPDKKILDKSNIVDNYFVDIRVIAWNKLYKKDIIVKNKLLFPKGLRYEDIAFCYMYLPFAKKIGYVDEGFCHYLQRDDSIANTQNPKVREIYDIIKVTLDYYKDNNLLDKYYSEMEYVTTKLILGRSFYRINSLKDKKLRKDYLNEGYNLLNKEFPKWKSNKYLRTKKGFKNFYYRHMNRVIYNIFAKVLQVAGDKIMTPRG